MSAELTEKQRRFLKNLHRRQPLLLVIAAAFMISGWLYGSWGVHQFRAKQVRGASLYSQMSQCVPCRRKTVGAASPGN